MFYNLKIRLHLSKVYSPIALNWPQTKMMSRFVTQVSIYVHFNIKVPSVRWENFTSSLTSFWNGKFLKTIYRLSNESHSRTRNVGEKLSWTVFVGCGRHLTNVGIFSNENVYYQIRPRMLCKKNPTVTFRLPQYFVDYDYTYLYLEKHGKYSKVQGSSRNS